MDPHNTKFEPGYDDLDSSLEAVPSTVAEQVPVKPSYGSGLLSLRFNRAAFLITGAALSVIVIIGVAVYGLTALYSRGHGGNNAQQNANYAVGTLPIEKLKPTAELQGTEADHLSINGELQVNNTEVITPGSAPSAPVTGQIYYDKTTNQPYFYDGSKFVSLDPNGLQHVTSLGGATGSILLGNGLQVSGNRLSIATSLLQSVGGAGVAGSGVTSLQGLTGAVTLHAGGGIAIAGTTITNSGVTSLLGTANEINVSSNSGAVTISLPQAIDTAANVQFNSLVLGGGDLSLAAAATVHTDNITTVGAGDTMTINADGNLVFSNSSGANTFTFPTSGGPGQVICTTAITCAAGGGQAVLLEPTAAQTASANKTTVFINKTGGTGNLIELQDAGSDALVIDNAGNTTISKLTVSAGLTVTGGTVTLSILNSTGVLHTNNIGQVSTGPVVLGTDTSGNFLASLGAVTGLVVGGTNAIPGAVPTLSVNYGALANTAVQGNTTLTCPSGTGNLSGGGNSITLGNGGSCNNITITNNPVFSGTLTVQGAGGITVGVPGTTTGSLVLSNSGSANGITLQAAAETAGNATVTIPNTAGVNDTVCLLTLSNCVGTGGGVTTTGGTQDFITKYNNAGANQLTNSEIFDNGSGVAIGSVSPVGLFNVGASNQFQVSSSGAITAPSSGNTINSLIINSGALSGVTGYTQASGNFDQSASSGTFKTGSGAVSLNGDTTIAGTHTLTVGSGLTSLGGGLSVTAGLTTLSGGLTLTGAANINTTGTANTAIGNATGTFSLASAGLNVSAAGALSGVTSITASGNINTTAGAFQLNGTSINTAGTLTNVAYQNQANNFTIANNQFTAAGTALSVTNNASIGGTLTVGTPGTGTGSLVLGNAANARTVTLQAASQSTGSSTVTIPDTAGVNDTVCLLTLANCVGTGGGLSGSGTVGTIPEFGGTNSLTNSPLTDTSGNLSTTGSFSSVGLNSGTGLLQGTGGLTLTGAANINTTGTANTAIGNATGTFSLASAGLNVSAAGALSGVTSITASGNINTTAGAFQLNGTSINTAGTLTNVAYQNQANNFTIANNQFTAAGTALSVTNNASIGGTLTVGNAGTSAGTVSLANGSSARLVNLQGLNPSGTGNATIQFPSIVGGTTDTVCLVSLGNCAGSGGGITGSGTPGTFAEFSGTGSIANSPLTDVSGDLTASGNLTVQGTGGLTVGVTGSTTGNLVLANSSSANNITLQGAAETVGDATVTIPDTAGANDTVCLLTLANCVGTGGGLSGTGTAGTIPEFNGTNSLANSPLTDSAGNLSTTGSLAAVGLNSGTGLLQGTGGLTLTGTTSINATGTANTSIGNATGTFAVTSAGLNITAAGAVTEAGALTVNNTSYINTNSTVALNVEQNGVHNNVLTVDTTNAAVGINQVPVAGVGLSVTGSIVGTNTIQGANFTINASSTANGLNKNYTVGTGGVTINDVVVLANDGGNSRVIDTTTSHDTRVMGVAFATATSGNPDAIVIAGNAQVTADTGAVAIGDQLVTSTTSGQVTVDNNATTGILGYATTAKAGGSSGLVGVYVHPVNGVANPVIPGNLTVQGVGTSSFAGNINTTAGAFQLNGTSINTAGTLTNVAYQNQANNFTIANNQFTAAGTALSVTNNASIGGTLTVGTPGTGTGSLVLGNAANARTVTLQAASQSTGSSTVTIPDTAGVNDTVCLLTLANCVGTGGGVSTAGGTAGTIPVFTGGSAIGDSLLSQSGGTVTANGNFNLTTGNQYQINGIQIASSNLSNDSNLAKLNASQTFTGSTNTFENASNSTTAFQIQNAGGVSVLTVDTSDQRLSVGTAGTAVGQLYVGGLIPTSPVGTFGSTIFYQGGIVTSGDYNYSIDHGGNLRIMDISDPSNPTVMSTTNFGGFGNGNTTIIKQGNHLYINKPNNTNALMLIIDITNPAAPTLAGLYDSGSCDDSHALAVQGRFAYLSCINGANNYLQTIDISNPTNPVAYGSPLSLAGDPAQVTIEGNYLYSVYEVTSGTAMEDISIENPASLSVVGSIPVGTNTSGLYGSSGIAIGNRYAYVSDGGASPSNGRVVDISDPTNPAVVGSFSVGSGAGGLDISGNRLYVYNGSAGTISVDDITTPLSAGNVGTISSMGNGQGMTVVGRYLYVDSFNINPSFQIFDLGGTYDQQLQAGDIQTSDIEATGNADIGGNVNVQGGLTANQLTANADIAAGGNLEVQGSTFLGGPFEQRNNSNSGQAFTILDSGGNTILNVDTTHDNVGLGANTANARLTVAGVDTTSGNDALLVTNSGGNTVGEFRDDGFVGLGTGTSATFGNTSQGTPDTGDNYNGLVVGSQFKTGSVAPTISSMSVYVNAPIQSSPDNHFQVGIYTDSGGSPSAWVASSASTTLTGNAWNTVAVSASLAANTSYWLVYTTDATTLGDNTLDVDNVATPSYFYAGFTYGSGVHSGMPNSISGASVTDNLISIYATTTNINTPALTVGTNGAIGIGTASSTAPSANLQVVSPTNNTTAFVVQNASGANELSVDTTNNQVTLGTAGTVTGQLTFANAVNSNTVSIVTATQANNVALTIPADANSTDTICLETLANCGGGGGGALSGSGTAGTIAVFTGSTALGNSLLSESGSTVTTAASAIFKNPSDSTTAFQVQDAAGTNTVLDIDTTNGRLGVNTVPTTAALQVSGTTSIGYVNSVGAFGVKNNNSVSEFGVDTVNNYVAINAPNAATVGTPAVNSAGLVLESDYWNGTANAASDFILQNIAGSSAATESLQLQNNAKTPIASFSGTGEAYITSSLDTLTNTGLSIGNANANGITLGNTGLDNLTTIVGSTLVESATGLNSTNAFQVQNASGNNELSVDTSGNKVTIGNVSASAGQAIAGNLVFGDGTTDNFADTLNTSPLTGSHTISLPDADGTICLNSGNCSATGGGYVVLAPSAAQTDGTTNSSIFINKTGASGNLLELQKSSIDAFTVSNTGNLTLGTGSDKTISIAAQTTSNTAGNNLTIQSATGNGTGAGGAATLQGGTSGAGATGNGGAVNVTGGTANSTAGVGGQVTVQGGTSTGANAGGLVQVNGGTAGASGAGGAVTIQATAGGATAGNGGAVTIKSGNGTASGTNAGAVTIDTGVPNGAGVAFLNLGNTNAKSITLGNQANSTVNIQGNNSSAAVQLQASNGGTILIGNVTSSSVNTISIGSTGANPNADAVSINTAAANDGSFTVGGTGNDTGSITLGQSTGTNTITVGNGATASGKTQTIQIGTAGVAGSSTAVTIGSALGTTGDTVKLQGGSTVETIANAGATVQTTTNSTTAFQVQNASGEPIFNLDNTGDSADLITNADFETNSTGWAGDGAGSVATSGTAHLYGAQSLAITTTTAAGDGAKYPIALSPNTSYTLDVPLYSTSLIGLNALSIGYSDTGVVGGEPDFTTNVTTIGANTWVHAYLNFTTGATVNGASYVYIKQNGAGTARTFYTDGPDLEQTTNAAVQYRTGTVQLTGAITSPLVVQSPVSNNNTAALSILNSSGQTELAVDTVNNQVLVGTAAGNGKFTVVSGSTQIAGRFVTTGSNTADGLQVESDNTSGTETNGIFFNRDTAGGNTTNGLNITDTLGNLTNGISVINANAANTLTTGIALTATNAITTGISFSGAGGFTNLINAPNFNVSNAGVVTLQGNQTNDITVAAQGTSNTAGNNLTLGSSAGNGTGSGGTTTLQAAASGVGVTGNGGNVNITAGNAASTNGSGGNIILTAGTKTGTGSVGGVSIPFVGAGSTTAFQIQGNTNPILTVDNNGNHVILGATGACAGPGSGRLCVNQGIITGTGSIVNQNNSTTVNDLSVVTTYASYFNLADTSSSVANTDNIFYSDASGSTNTSASVNSITAKVTASQPGSFLQFQNGSNTVLSVANTGATTLSATNAAALLVQNASSVALLNANTSTNTLTVATTAGGELVNDGATLNTAKSLGNFGSNGAIGTAAATVDIYTTFVIPQTTPSISLTVPNPTDTTAGRVIYIANTGSVTLTVAGITLTAGSNMSLLWNGSAWTSTAVSTGVTIVGTLDTPGEDTSANGATISGNTIYLQSATTTVPGLVNNTAQTFSGNKAFESTTNSTTAFQIQNSSGSSGVLLNADTTNMRLGVNVTYTAMTTPSAPTVNNPTNGGNLASATHYWYKISALDSLGGETAASTEADNATATSGTNKTISVSWTAVTGASAYNVYRSTSSGTEVYLTTVMATSFKDTGQFTAGTASPLSTGTAYVSTNVANNNGQLAVGGNGKPTGQLYVSGTVPSSAIGDISMSGAPTSVAISGHYAYVAASVGNMQVFDISNPQDPVLVGTNSNGGEAIYVQGHYAYVEGTNSMVIVDISNPASPTTVGSANLSSLNNSATVNSIYVSGSYAYVAEWSGHFDIFNVSNPTNPFMVGSFNEGGDPDNVFVSGRYAYVANWSNQIYVYDVSNPASASQVATINGSGSSNFVSVYVQGSYLYALNDNDSTLDVVNVSNPTTCASNCFTSTISTGVGSALYVQGRYAYVTSGSSTLGVYDISNPYASCASSCAVGTLSTGAGSNPQGIAVSGRYAYVADSGTNQLAVYDVGGEYAQQLQAGGIETSTLQVDTNASVYGDASVQGGLTVGQNTNLDGYLGVAGPVLLQNNSNSTTALQISNSTNTNELNVDTSNNKVDIGSLATPTGLSWASATGGSLSSGLTYYFRVTAVDAAGNQSAPSAEFVCTSSCSTTATKDEYNVSWTAVTGAVSYNVYYGTTAGSEANFFNTASSPYTFSTTAGNSAGSPPSTSASYGAVLTASTATFRSLANSSTAFQIQNAAGTSLFNADTTNSGAFTFSGVAPASVSSGNGTAASTILTVTGPAGGAITGGTGTQTSGAGAAISLTSGAGGNESGSSGTATAGAGGAFTLQGGNGGNATSGKGGAGANLTFQGGNGGSSSGTNNNANGGNITLTGGTGGTGGSGTVGNGGNVSIDAGSGTLPATQIADKTFETTTENMTVTNNAAVTNTGPGHLGTHSLQITVAGTGGWQVGDATPFVINTVVPGHTYAFSAWVKAATTGDAEVFDAEFSPNGFYNANFVGSIVWGTITDTTAGFTQVTGTLTAPAGATYVGLGIASLNGVNGEVHYVDDMTVTDITSSGSALNLGTTNAQGVTIGNATQTVATTVQGGYAGTNILAGSGGQITLQSAGLQSAGASEVLDPNGNLTITLQAMTTGPVDQGGEFQIVGVDGTLLDVNADDDNTALGLAGVGFTGLQGGELDLNSSNSGGQSGDTDVTATGGNINLSATTTGKITIGGTSETGTITLGQSTGTNIINIGSATTASTKTQTINIGNGTGAGTAINVNILSGVGTAGNGRLNLGNNTRVNEIDLGNINPAAARSINIGNDTGTANSVVDTINVGTNPTTVAGGNTVHIADGTPTGSGTNLVTIGSLVGASATTLQSGTGNINLNVNQAGAGVLVKTVTTNSTTAFQVQNASGNSVLTVDTSTGTGNGQVILGSSSHNNGTLLFDESAGAAQIGLTTTSSNINSYTLDLPITAPGTSQCLQSGAVTANQLTFGSCSGGGGTLQGAYNASAGASPSIDMTSTNLGFTVQNDNSSPITGELFGVHDKTASGLGTGLFTVSNTGAIAQKTTTNSTTGLLVQNSSGNALLTGDTSNMRLSVNATYTQIVAPGTISKVNDTGTLTSGSTYRYEVTALDAAGGETTVSPELSVTGATGYDLSWSSVTGAYAYRVYRTAANGSTGTEKYLATVLNTATTSTYKDLGAVTTNTNVAPPGSNTAYYASTNSSVSSLQLTVGGNGSPTGQLYVSGNLKSTSLSSYPTKNVPSYSAIEGNYLYIIEQTAGTGTMQVFDISNPAVPALVSTTSLQCASPDAIAVEGNYTYIVDNSGACFEVYNIANPSSPSLANGAAATTTAQPPVGIYVQGKYAYVVGGTTTSQMQIFDISNPANPTSISTFTTAAADPENVYVQGNYAYVLDSGGNALEIINVSNPSSPSDTIPSTGIIGTGSGSPDPSQVVVQGNYAYIANPGNNTIQIFNVSNPASPTTANANGFSTGANTSPGSLFIQGRYMYVVENGTSGNKLVAYDISNPSNPVSVNTATTGNDPYFIVGNGRYAYVIDNNSPGTLETFDLGGTYTQQLEAGGISTGTLQTEGNSDFNGDANIQGGLTVGSSLNVSGAATVSGGLVVGAGSSGETTPKLLVLDNGTSSGDPTGVSGALYYNANTGNFRCDEAGAWEDCIGGLMTSNTSASIPLLGNTMTAQSFSLTGSLPANYCTAGRVIHIVEYGVYTTNGAPESLTFTIKLGGTTIAAPVTGFSPSTSLTNVPWGLDLYLICNAAPGSSVSVNPQGRMWLNTNATTSFTQFPIVNATAVGGVNTTTSNSITSNLTFTGTGSTGNSMTMDQLIITGM